MLIGDYKPKNNIFLAPMAGITDMPFRVLCAKQGCGMVTTEMVSAKGLFYNDEKSYQLLEINPSEGDTSIQIFGSDPEIIQVIAYKLNNTMAVTIDINMGCPAPKVTKSGDGSALMKNPELAFKVMKAVCKESQKPVTVKIRKGWDDESINAVQIAKMAEQAGIMAITVHGRTRNQYYSGISDWDIIKSVKDSVRIPVIGNGDIKGCEDVAKMLTQTGCDGVMIGRGAQGNPWIFSQVLHYLTTGEKLPMPSIRERISTISRQLSMLANIKGEHTAICEMRKHIAWYIKGLKNATQIKNKVFTMTSRDDILTLLDEYIDRLEAGELK